MPNRTDRIEDLPERTRKNPEDADLIFDSLKDAISKKKNCFHDSIFSQTGTKLPASLRAHQALGVCCFGTDWRSLYRLRQSSTSRRSGTSPIREYIHTPVSSHTRLKPKNAIPMPRDKRFFWSIEVSTGSAWRKRHSG